MRRAVGIAAIAASALMAPGLAAAQQPAPVAPAPEVLVQDDPAALSAWRGVREKLSVRLVDLRAACDQGGTAGDERASRSIADMRKDLLAFSDMAGRLAHEEKPEIDAVMSRANRLLDNLYVDRSEGTRAQVQATLRLLEDSIKRLEDLAMRSDQRLGRRPATEVAAIPADWQRGAVAEEGTAAGLSLLDARTLRSEIGARRADLSRDSHARLGDDQRRAAAEVGEMARALVARQGEVPALSRRGFVNCALRIEVIADNMVVRIDEADRPSFRRQLIALGEALEDLDGYIDVQQRLAEPSP